MQLSRWPRRALTPEQVRSLEKQLRANRRPDLVVSRLPHVTLAQFREAGLSAAGEALKLEALAGEIRARLGGEGRVLFVGSTETGGGVPETRAETTAMLKSLGLRDQVEWLVIDGAKPFYAAVSALQEALQSRTFSFLALPELETLQLWWIASYERLLGESQLDTARVVWLDDVAVVGLAPILRALHPEIGVVWRCHLDTADPNTAAGSYVRHLLDGSLDSERSRLLRAYLAERKGLEAGDLFRIPPIHLGVFHTAESATGLGLRVEQGVATMPPAINPVSFKNMPVSEAFLNATLAKYGIVGQGGERPPLAVQISRFDPIKGPIETLIAFVLAWANLRPEIRDAVHFVYAGNLPPDSPMGADMFAGLQRLVQGLPDRELAQRIHVLKLEDTAPLERMAQLLTPLLDDPATDGPRIREFLSSFGQHESEKAWKSLKESGLLPDTFSQKIDEESVLAFSGRGVWATSEQRAALIESFEELKRPSDEIERARFNALSGKELNHLEVNALQSAGTARLQFSSKEGFGLVVSEAMIKEVRPPFGVTVVTAVGGIQGQLAPETCHAIRYPGLEVAESLQLYRRPGFRLTRDSWNEIFELVAARTSVQAFAVAMAAVLNSRPEEREPMCRRAYEHTRRLYATHTNVLNLLGAIARVMEPAPRREAEHQTSKHTQAAAD